MMSMNTMPEAPSRAVWGEQQALQDPRDQGGEQDALQQGDAAVFLFHRRADDQQQKHIVQEMIPVGVAQHMAEEPEIEQRVFQGAAVDAEQVPRGPAAGPLPQKKGQEREQKEGEDHRGIVLQLQCQFGTFRKRFILSEACRRADGI